MKRKEILKGANIHITTHAIQRYLDRAGIMSEEMFERTLKESHDGNRDAKNFIEKHRKELTVKFKNSVLQRFLKNGAEMRSELSGSMNKRCTFVCYKKGNRFTVVTAYLQGHKNNVWKIS